MISQLANVADRSRNLPVEIASFIGRRREIDEILHILGEARLISLTGTGGAGKTRLALRAASESISMFPDGAWLVQLAPLTDGTSIARAVASVFGVRGTPGRPLLASLVAALGSRRLLLVLDNCEHVVGAAARLVEAVLESCPQVRILATSREPLRIPGEVVRRVPPLAQPELERTPSLETLLATESVALFLDRARSRRPDFALTADNARAVAVICRQLEGLPLAIELAAAQLDAFTPAEIAGRMDDSLRVLRGGSRNEPRQETLHAALNWSHGLLTGTEQVLFRRLSVFSGGFDLSAVEDVCSGHGVEPDQIPALIAALIRKSLVEVRTGESASRYRLLEPVRQYAQQRLVACGEDLTLQRRHARYFTGLAEVMEPIVMSRDRAPAMARLDVELDNIRAALGWSLRGPEGGDRELGLRLAGSLMFFWFLRGEISEGQEWTEAVLARAGDADPEARARALHAGAELAWLVGRTDLARTRIEEAEALFRSLKDERRLAYTLQSLPMTVDNPRAEEARAESLRLFRGVGDAWGSALALFAVDLFGAMANEDAAARVRAQLESALALWRELGDDWGISQVLNMLGDLARSQGNDPEAGERYEEALALLRRQGMTGTVPSLLHNLAYVALRRGDSRRSMSLFRECLALFRDQGDQRGMADGLTGIACVLVGMGHLERAARLFGAAETLRGAIGASIWPANRPALEQALEALQKQLPEPDLRRAWAAGGAMSADGAVAEVLAEEPQHDGFGPAGDLTPREREVAALLAEGLTNRQIGARLFITEGTARLHVKHILQKLGFARRAQVAAWAVEQGLAQPAATN